MFNSDQISRRYSNLTITGTVITIALFPYPERILATCSSRNYISFANSINNSDAMRQVNVLNETIELC